MGDRDTVLQHSARWASSALLCATVLLPLGNYLPLGSLGLPATADFLGHWSDLLAEGVLVAAAVFAVLVSAGRGHRGFWVWTVSALGLFLAGNAMETMAWIEGRSKVLDWNDGLFIAAYLLLIGHQWRVLAAESRRRGLVRTLIEYLTTVVAGALVIWFLLVGEISAGLGTFSAVERFGLISFATLDVLVGFTFFTMLFTAVEDPRLDYRTRALLYSGWALYLAADLTWHANTFHGDPGFSTAVAVLTDTGRLLQCAGIWWFIRSPTPAPLTAKTRETLSASSSFAIFILVYVTLLAFGRYGSIQSADYPLLVFVGIAILAIMLRQFYASREIRLERARTEALLAYQQAVFAQIPLGMVLADGDGHILQVNPAFEKLVGFDLSELRARGAAPFLVDATPAEVFGAQMTKLFEDDDIRLQVDLRRKSGSVFKAGITGRPLPEAALSGATSAHVWMVEDITLRRAIAEQQASLQSILENSPLGVAFAVNWTVRYANSVFQEMFGLGVGGDASKLFPSRETQDRLSVLLQSDGRIQGVETCLVAANGESRDYLTTAMPFALQGEEGVMLWLLDITERKRIEQEILRAKEVAEEATRVKGDFLANISHELRTPMNGIVGSLALVSTVELPKAQRELLEQATRSADALSRIINDVLDYVKLDTAQSSVRADDFGVSSMFGFLRSRFGAVALQKGIDLRFMVDPEAPASITGDRYRLSQVLVQLVDNAIRFTDSGSVTVSVRPMELDQGRSCVKLEFCVRDTGCGIAPSDLKRIFSGFEQADNSSTRRIGGAGLGLAICARIAKLLGGKIWVESVAGEGSAFYVALDFGIAAESADVLANPAMRLAGTRLLLVEDNPLNREIATNILASAGIDVVIAEHGREALDILARDAHVDGVLMDIHMPVMDGYATTRAIRAQDRFRELPIIAVTANVMLANTADAMAVGMNDCVPKPLKPTLLFETLAHWIRPSRSTSSAITAGADAGLGAAAAAGATPQRGSASIDDPDAQEMLLRIPGVDVEKALTQALNDIGFYRRMLRRFTESHAEFRAEFRDAQVSSDPGAALRCAHTLKGNAANIGATALQVAAGELEDACRNQASVDTIERMFKETVAQLALVLDGIGKVGVIDSGATGSQSGADGPQIDAAEVAAQLVTINALLAESDPAATDLLLKLLPRVRDTDYESDIRLAANAAENFEFEEALRALQSIHGTGGS